MKSSAEFTNMTGYLDPLQLCRGIIVSRSVHGKEKVIGIKICRDPLHGFFQILVGCVSAWENSSASAAAHCPQ